MNPDNFYTGNGISVINGIKTPYVEYTYETRTACWTVRQYAETTFFLRNSRSVEREAQHARIEGFFAAEIADKDARIAAVREAYQRIGGTF